ncbi:MAG: hypothetical protein AAF694_27330 [Bacteroidota bacterium]
MKRLKMQKVMGLGLNSFLALISNHTAKWERSPSVLDRKILPPRRNLPFMRWMMLGILTVVATKHSLAQAHATQEQRPEHSEKYVEIITSIINAHSLEENEGSIGNELHVTYWFQKGLGAGISLTAKVKETKLLYDIALIGSWSPAKWITTNIGPNLSWEGRERDFGVSAYIEVEINLHVVDKIHIGPVVGTLLGQESELTHGFHLGFEL